MQAPLFHQQLTPELVLGRLHLGAANGMTARDLVYLITGKQNAAEERRLRHVIEHLRLQGHAVCAHPSLGYFLAANDAELDDACGYLYGRACTSLKQISAMKRVALPDLRGQLGLPLESDPETEHGSAAET